MESDFVSCRVVVIGDLAVGKTCLLTRFVEDTYNEFTDATVGGACFSKTIRVKGVNVKMQLWDTAGQERFHSLTATFFRGAKIAMVCVDVTRPTTLEKADEWIQEVNEKEPSCCIVVVATKVDVAESSERAISKDQIQQLAKKYNAKFVETSAKTGHNVTKAFTIGAEEYLIKENITDAASVQSNATAAGFESIKLKAPNNAERGSCYC